MMEDQRRSAPALEDDLQALSEDLQRRARDKYYARVVVPVQTTVDQAIAARDAYKKTLLNSSRTTSGGLFYALITTWSFRAFLQDVGLRIGHGYAIDGCAIYCPESLDSSALEDRELYDLELAVRKCGVEFQRAVDKGREISWTDRVDAIVDKEVFQRRQRCVTSSTEFQQNLSTTVEAARTTVNRATGDSCLVAK